MKKGKLKKTLVEQILDKAGIVHEPLALNALKDELPDGISKADIYKTLALTGNNGPVIGILPLTQHLSEKKLAKVSGNKQVSMIAQKDLQKTTGYINGANNPVSTHRKHPFPIWIAEVALSTSFMIGSAGGVARSIPIQQKVLANFVHACYVDSSE